MYSQLSKLDKSSTSSRAAFLFGATVNSGQNKRSQIAFNMECAKGTWGLEAAFGEETSPRVAVDELASSLSMPKSFDFESYKENED